KKKKLKIIHTLVQLGTFHLLCGRDRRPCVSTSTMHLGIPNMYSLHSWVGLCVVILFACQPSLKELAVRWNRTYSEVKSGGQTVATFELLSVIVLLFLLLVCFLAVVHQFFGLAIFIGSVASCLLGLTEKGILFDANSKSNGYNTYHLRHLNECLSAFCDFFARVVVYLMSNSPFPPADF
ncbi:transmembrane ascorbate-dependent reductase CYB561-like, partial [Penaeus indicus]|uniref:transmembrane ascorbate-dependent reductase CYB561-like n=1 Tax=Penaeus indicus TaxID=29960 RepID=UPI00300C8CE7